MPDLENLKKQAKLVLRWHREQHYPVAVHIRTFLPQFQGMSDAEVLAATFKLSDSQLLVAREHGFESWQALRDGLAPSGDKPDAPARAKIMTAEPQLFVTDIHRSCDFYCQKLAFSIVFSYGEPPYYAQVVRDGARLNLRCVPAPTFAQMASAGEDLLSASMTLGSAAEIKMLFLEFQSAAIPFHQTLKKQPWGARNFIVKDPDGNLLLFAGPAR